MTPIERGAGTTESERYLAKLADRTFLNLWSYPNVFINKKAGVAGDGKEMCDLLVVCGDHVLIFSDKTIGWPGGDDVALAWRRWYRRAIQKSVDQIRGARRWLNDFPDRIFLDRACTQRLPLPLPPIERRKVHGIVVARGAGEACRSFCNEGTGSLLILPDIRGEDHVRENGLQPFAIGDVDPDEPFVHVLDDATLDIVMKELDTITDLTGYLEKKEKLIRSRQLAAAGGEEDLIAYYMTHMNAAGQHDFTKSDGSSLDDDESLALDSGVHAGLMTHPQYLAKKDADEVSYVWDRLIEAFTTNMLKGTTILPEGETFDLAKYERGVRHMALVPRYFRRQYGRAILDALERGKRHDRFTRGMLPGPDAPERDTGFFFMTLAVPKFELKDGYQQYRRVRAGMLEGYALMFLRNNPHLKRVVGIAAEPPRVAGEQGVSSEDMIMAEVSAWTPELLEDLAKRREMFDIAREGRYREYAISGKEFPDPPMSTPSSPAASPLNRKQRRALKAKARRKR